MSFDRSIINVGNLNVGGTGKTPMIEYLVRLLQDEYRLGTLSRGYKRTTKGFVLANANSTPQEIGDEPMQYYTKFDQLIVTVDNDRLHGIEQFNKFLLKPDVILLDDAYQHRKVNAGFNILLTSFDNLYSNDWMLPAGNLREKRKGAKRAQIIIVTKCPEILGEEQQLEIKKQLKVEKDQFVFFSKIKYADEIIGKEGLIAMADLPNYEILLVTGIANTKPLVQFLEGRKIKFQHVKYGDHYEFTKKDNDNILETYSKIENEKKIILTTEKDYVRSFKGVDNFYYLPIETVFIDHQNDFDKRIKDYVEQSSKNSRVFTKKRVQKS